MVAVKLDIQHLRNLVLTATAFRRELSQIQDAASALADALQLVLPEAGLLQSLLHMGRLRKPQSCAAATCRCHCTCTAAQQAPAWWWT